jgi:hypothetical protein
VAALAPRGEIRPLRGLSDEQVKRPLWEFPPAERRDVIRERRKRFGWDDGEDRDVG